jgi:hypothetical protein
MFATLVSRAARCKARRRVTERVEKQHHTCNFVKSDAGFSLVVSQEFVTFKKFVGGDLGANTLGGEVEVVNETR